MQHLHDVTLVMHNATPHPHFGCKTKPLVTILSNKAWKRLVSPNQHISRIFDLACLFFPSLGQKLSHAPTPEGEKIQGGLFLWEGVLSHTALSVQWERLHLLFSLFFYFLKHPLSTVWALVSPLLWGSIGIGTWDSLFAPTSLCRAFCIDLASFGCLAFNVDR